MKLLSELHTALSHVLTAQYPTHPATWSLEINSDPAKQAFGDLTTNCALIVAKHVGKNPRAVAQELTAALTHSAISRTEIAGPGFINIFLTADAWHALAQEAFSNNERFFKPAESTLPRYNIEFVSANPTGPLHLGHGRGGIIGDVLGNIIRFLGGTVTKEFYINDAGSQIQKLGDSLKIRYLQAAGKQVELPEEGYHGEYLIALGQQLYAQHGEALVDNDVTFFAQWGKDQLLAALKETLKNYGITYDVWFSEKTLHTSGAIDRALALLDTNGYLYTQEGAQWFASTRFGDDKDRVVRRANGELTYVAADVAYLENKIERGFEKLVMVLGQDHHSYVVRLKAALAALGHNTDMLDVILYQLVTLKESGELVRMSKRSGKMVTLDDVIAAVGSDVARFFYLHRKADAHLEFDIALALKHTEENPVYYIQYAYVRTNSILEKAAQHQEFTHISAADITRWEQSELVVFKKICALAELLQSISHNYQTHLLTYYVIELANTFHKYYAQHRVIDTENPAVSRARLALIILLRSTLGLCFDLLGIQRVERM